MPRKDREIVTTEGVVFPDDVKGNGPKGAFARGWQAGIDGRERFVPYIEGNPFKDGPMVGWNRMRFDMWRRGWQAAYRERARLHHIESEQQRRERDDAAWARDARP